MRRSHGHAGPLTEEALLVLPQEDDALLCDGLAAASLLWQQLAGAPHPTDRALAAPPRWTDENGAADGCAIIFCPHFSTAAGSLGRSASSRSPAEELARAALAPASLLERLLASIKSAG